MAPIREGASANAEKLEDCLSLLRHALDRRPGYRGDPPGGASQAQGASVARRGDGTGEGPAQGSGGKAGAGHGRSASPRRDPGEEVPGGAQEGRRIGRASSPSLRRRLTRPYAPAHAPAVAGALRNRFTMRRPRRTATPRTITPRIASTQTRDRLSARDFFTGSQRLNPRPGSVGCGFALAFTSARP